jgi:hypothetical protein
MKLYCLLSTSFFFLLPAMALYVEPNGLLTWGICSSYLYLHLFHKKHVYYFHSFDKINHYWNQRIELN